jgi:pimeloyl-ACP methyl ester carboxylesterase
VTSGEIGSAASQRSAFVLARRGCPLHYWVAGPAGRPLLLVHGSDDRLGDIRAIAPRWAAATPNCQYEVIAHARHFAFLDQAEHFNRLLLPFLAQWCG